MNVEKYISRTLRWGVAASSVFIIAGIMLLFIHLPSATENHIPTLKEVLGVFSTHTPLMLILNPYIYLYCGIFIIMITPIIRVIISILSFALEKDWRFVIISSFVLVVISISISISILL